LCAQRNTALRMVRDSADILVFFDDDYLPSNCALEGIEDFFRSNSDVVGANGVLIKDGINGPGLDYDRAIKLISEYDEKKSKMASILGNLNGLYGCNMAYRNSAIGDISFDEMLPLYGWQEDVDFASQVGRRGRLVKTDAWAGVHRGVKTGRSTEMKFGYSQVANPVYLTKKGTMRRGEAYTLVMRNLLANHIRAVRPEPWVDRVGRVKGNWRALRDLAHGRLRPEVILEF
jgi:glycosyltransferase involved in cell wall biosynthesis